MKIGFIAHYNPNDRRAWSGTYSAIIDQLKKYYEVEFFYKKLNFFEKEFFFEQRNWYRWVRKKILVIDFLRDYSKLTSRKLDKMLKKNKCDLLIAPASNQRFAYSQTNIPIIMVADATFVLLNEYYPLYSNVPSRNLRQGIALDKKAYHKAAHIICASQWAANSAINDYNVDPQKISILPFGPNLKHLPEQDEVKWERKGVCRLLFLGINWERKGGAIALKAAKELERLKMNVHLTIIGCVPPSPVDNANTTVIPYLNKNIPEEEKQLFDYLQQSDFLILPTRAECAGIVFCEASAFGLPIVATDTGGVSTYVVEDQNGFLLPPTDTGEGYAKKIFEVFNDEERYNALRKKTLEFYKEKLTWEAWGKSFKRIAEKVLTS
ncbi:MAG TPA: glycosyltransferase family 4 protein [Segetibacter sp.]|jgi:glycosyltransferase involved in cell wall biosynthesis